MEILFLIYRLCRSRSAALVALYTAVSLIASHMLGVVAAITQQIAAFDALTLPTFGSVGLDVAPLALMNYFIPLDIAIIQFVAWLALWLVCVAIRIVKSWIPTIS